MSQSPGKRTIGHDALRIALDHERTCANDLFHRNYTGNGEYVLLKESDPVLWERLRRRWDDALAFASWAQTEFIRVYDTSPEKLEGGTNETRGSGDRAQGGGIEDSGLAEHDPEQPEN